jgi:hypothetical protein
MNMEQRYRKYSIILLSISTILLLAGLGTGYEYIRARMCYNSFFSPTHPIWCEGNLSRYADISRHWWNAGATTGLLIPIALSISGTCLVISRRQAKSLYKAPAYLGLLSIGLLMLGITSLRLMQTKWPGNTINWRHDQAMQQLSLVILISSAILFLVTITAAFTCAIASRKNTHEP